MVTRVVAAVLVMAGGSAAVSDSVILWSADHETGDISEWEWRQGGGIYNSHTPPGTSEIVVSRDVARSGKHSLRLSLTGAENGAKQGARMFRTWLTNDVVVEPLPDQGYYSAWYLFPERFDTQIWWNIFQFKSKVEGGESKPMLSFNIDNRANGSMELYVWDTGAERSYGPDRLAIIPAGEWVHLEAYLDVSTTTADEVLSDGALRVWVNGVEVVNETGLRTRRDPMARIHWSVNNYTDDIRPSDPTIYVDDAAISTTRLSTLLPTCTIVGTPGDDVLTGTAADDVICGLGGDDTIHGMGGADTIFAGPGSDTVRGGAGADWISGGHGADVIHGHGGADVIYGDSGADLVFAGPGRDRVLGGLGDDVVKGGDGDDRLFGEKGADQVVGGPGTDVVNGGPGRDTRIQ